MKTFKILAVLLIGLILTSANARSQPVRVVFEKDFVLPFDCLNQNLTGTLTVEWTSINNHIQVRHYGTVKGESDGLEYFADMMTNIEDKANWDEYGEQAITQTWPANYHISRDGKLIAIIHFSYHYTVNANGEWTSYHGDVFECNLAGAGRYK